MSIAHVRKARGPEYAITDAYAPGPTRLSFEGSVLLRKSGLHISNSISFRKWEGIGHQLLSVADSSTWWIADWLLYGESSFQERYPEAIRRTSLNYQTLRNYAWVARRFVLSRRRDSLSFGHHAEVAALEESEQDYWLRRAEELGWSRNQLRREVRASLLERHPSPASQAATSGVTPSAELAEANRPAPIGEEALRLRLTTDQMERFTAAAQCRNLSLDEWAIDVLNTAASSAA